jgi:hypothetical protein
MKYAWHNFGLLPLMLAFGCGGASGIDALDNADAAITNSPASCYAPTGAMSAVPECAAARFCAPAKLDTEINTANCSASSCRFTYAPNVGDTLTYEDDKLYVFLRFGGSIAGAKTTADLKSVFEHVNFMRKYPGSVAGMSSDPLEFEQSTDIGRFEIFELAGGTLHVRLRFTLAAPYVWIRSTDSACRDLDVMGMCVCTFSVPPQSGVVDVTLPADIP